MFNEKQIAALKDTLNAKHVKQRAQSGRNLSYIEGWWAIAEANRIFGFDAWNRELFRLEQGAEPKLGKDKNGNDQWRANYIATVRITVWADEQMIVRDGTGYGSGIDRDLGSAIESAVKEAETDAMKRALMTFGNPFGLALYDKEQVNVEYKADPIPDDHPAMIWAAEVMTNARNCENADQLTKLWKDNTDSYKSCFDFDKGLAQEVKATFTQMKSALTKEAA